MKKKTSIKDFTYGIPLLIDIETDGIQDQLDAPAIIVDTEHDSPSECLAKILSRLTGFGYLEKER